MKDDGVASALLAKLREWTAAIGVTGCVFAIATFAAISEAGSMPTIIGYGLGGLGVASGVVGFRNPRAAGWLLAAAAIGLAIAAFALVAVAPRSS